MDYTVAFWNLENLFAPENHPDREAWLANKLAGELAGWTPALFNRKISQLSTVIRQMVGGAGPDLLGVCEVENRFVLDTLTTALNQALPGRDYDVVHVDSARDKRGIDTAFVYDKNRFTVEAGTVFSHFVIRRTGTRDITQASFLTQNNNKLVALCNHWPSRSGGAVEDSAGFRATAGETLSYWHERIREETSDTTAVIAMGDFNDNPFDSSIQRNALAGRERGDVERARSAQFYNLAWRYLSQEVTDHKGDQRVIDGTLYHGNDGNVFDQIFVNRALLKGDGGLQVKDTTAVIEAIPAMVDHRVGQGPIRFGRPSKTLNENGFSDHFPVSVQIHEN